MAEYAHQEDGKIHTRYSTLIRCTPGQIDRVIWELQNPDARVETEAMGFGTVRHEMLEEEAQATGRIPACFGIIDSADYVEHEFTTEIWKDIVIHSRPDAVSTTSHTIYDYKTVTDGKRGWKRTVADYHHEVKQRQLKFYAFQLGLHGIMITRGAFLCEIWNEARDEILDYQVVEFPINLGEISKTLMWVKNRAALLAAVLDEAQQTA